jgi:hypothetical protein
MPLILGTNSIKDTGFDVANSCRFDSGSDAHMHITYGSAGNQKKWSWSGWIKRGIEFTGQPNLFAVGTSSNTFSRIMFNNNSNLVYYQSVSGGTACYLQTDAVYRDPLAWMHILVSIDTTLSTANNRNRLWVNGTEVTSFTYRTNYDQNYDGGINDNVKHYLGGTNTGLSDNEWDGYMAEVVFQDGVAHTGAGDFGEFDEDSGIWKPKDVSGLTFGTNGFYLDFENSGSLGADVSGNGNNFTVNNLTSIDQTTDTCTLNYATSNPLIDSGTGYSQGNLDLSFGNGSQDNAGGTFGVSKGKWYWEHKIINSGNTHYIGIKSANSDLTSTSGATGTPSMYYTNDGNKVYNASSGGSSYGSTFSNNDIIGIALDLDNNAIWFSKNGAWQNSATQSEIEAGTTTNSAFSGTSSSDGFPSEQVYLPWIVGQAGGSAFTMTTNFGNPTFTISSGNSDGNGYGNFEYAVPSGYYALNTKNLAEYG